MTSAFIDTFGGFNIMEKKNKRFPDMLTYKLIQKNSFNSTLLKYFLSYFILLFLLLDLISSVRLRFLRVGVLLKL